MATSSTRQYSAAPKAAPQPQVVEHRHSYTSSRTPRAKGFKGGLRSRPSASYRAGRTVANAPESVAGATVGAASAQGIIVTSALVTFTLGFLNSYLVPRKTPRVRLFIGVAILYIGLSIVAQFNAKLARGFAVLVMVTALLAEGGGVLNWLMGRGTHDHIGLSSTGTPNLPAVRGGMVPKQLPPPQPLQRIYPGVRSN